MGINKYCNNSIHSLFNKCNRIKGGASQTSYDSREVGGGSMKHAHLMRLSLWVYNGISCVATPGLQMAPVPGLMEMLAGPGRSSAWPRLCGTDEIRFPPSMAHLRRDWNVTCKLHPAGGKQSRCSQKVSVNLALTKEGELWNACGSVPEGGNRMLVTWLWQKRLDCRGIGWHSWD